MTPPEFLDVESETNGDAGFRNFMRHSLARAAEQCGVTLTGPPVFGWPLKSIGAPAVGAAGQCWLRVVSQEPQWASGTHWTGTFDANDVAGIRKPSVLGVHEWTEGTWRTQRAEVMTLVPGQVCSPTDVLREPVALPESWWAQLRRSLTILAPVYTARTHADQAKVTDRIRERFGPAASTAVTAWATVHGDLHWNNLHRPDFAVLDWELWGSGPAGLDAATLHLFSLLVPDAAHRVYSTFADELDTPTGHVAQLYAAARLLRRIDQGDFPDLEAPIRQYAATIS